MTQTTIQDVADVVARHVGADRVVRPADARYEQARQVWNGAVTARPALIVCCRDATDVAVAVRAAREAGMPLSVRGGGHDWVGRALRDGGLVVDLSEMRGVRVRGDQAAVGGGASGTDVVAAAAARGLVAPSGSVGAVGMAGLTLGGGYGPLSDRIGLAADNLLGAEVVLADGSVVSTDDHPDLLWALRGGGGNFGVVTTLRVRLHPGATLLGGPIVFPWSQARAVLSRVDELAIDAPDKLTVQTLVVSGPDGAPCVAVLPTWHGDAEAGAAAIDRVAALGTPVANEVRPMSQAELVTLHDAFVGGGLHYYLRTRNLARLTAGAVEDLVAAGAARRSPQSAISIHQFHGAPTRVPPEATAFGLRADHLMVEIIAVSETADTGTHRAWADAVWAVLGRHALPGGYPNLLAPDHREQIDDAYGPNAARLRLVKRHYDPEQVFTAIPLPA